MQRFSGRHESQYLKHCMNAGGRGPGEAKALVERNTFWHCPPNPMRSGLISCAQVHGQGQYIAGLDAVVSVETSRMRSCGLQDSQMSRMSKNRARSILHGECKSDMFLTAQSIWRGRSRDFKVAANTGSPPVRSNQTRVGVMRKVPDCASILEL